MAKFKVTIIETRTKEIDIEADDAKRAKTMARMQWSSNMIQLTDTDITDVDYTVECYGED